VAYISQKVQERLRFATWWKHPKVNQPFRGSVSVGTSNTTANGRCEPCGRSLSASNLFDRNEYAAPFVRAHDTLRFRSTFQGREDRIWFGLQNVEKCAEKAVRKGLFVLPKSSFGEHKIATDESLMASSDSNSGHRVIADSSGGIEFRASMRIFFELCFPSVISLSGDHRCRSSADMFRT